MRGASAGPAERGAIARAPLRQPHRSRRRNPLLLALTLPRINEHMLSAVVAAVHPSAGAELAVGAKLVDLTVDLTAIAAQDCPPVSHFRMVVRERAWLRELAVARGDEIAVGTRVALFSASARKTAIPTSSASVSSLEKSSTRVVPSFVRLSVPTVPHVPKPAKRSAKISSRFTWIPPWKSVSSAM